MKENSRIKFNPSTNEIELEGSEEFINNMFTKIQELMPVSPARKIKVPSATVGTARRVKKEAKEEVLPLRKVKRVVKEKAAPEAEKTTLFDRVVGLIGGSEGITTAELKAKTGLTEKQIWSITYRAEKMGMIKKAKRGVYAPAG